MPKILIILCSIFIFICGCSSNTYNKINKVQLISEDHIISYLPFERSIAVIDSKNQKVDKKISVGKFSTAMDYAPNGKIYIGLTDDAGDPTAYIAVLDPHQGTLKYVPTRYTTDRVKITRDGTAYFISLISPHGNDSAILVMDTNKDEITGVVTLPMMALYMGGTGISDYDGHHVLIVGHDRQGNQRVYVVGTPQEQIKELINLDEEPTIAKSIVYDQSKQLLYALHYVKKDYSDHDLELMFPNKPIDRNLVQSHVSIWDVNTNSIKRKIFLPHNNGMQLIQDPNGMLYISYDKQPYIDIVNPDTGELKTLNVGSSSGYMLIKANNLYVSSNPPNNEVFIYELSSLKQIAKIDNVGTMPVFADRYLP